MSCQLEKFRVKFLNEFSSTRTDWQNRVDLYTLKQGKLSIFEYTSSFRAYSNLCNFGDEALLTGYFLGLNTNIQIYLGSLQTMPSTFGDIIATCLDYGSRHTIVRRHTFPRQNQHLCPFLPLKFSRDSHFYKKINSLNCGSLVEYIHAFENSLNYPQFFFEMLFSKTGGLKVWFE